MNQKTDLHDLAVGAMYRGFSFQVFVVLQNDGQHLVLIAYPLQQIVKYRLNEYKRNCFFY